MKSFSTATKFMCSFFFIYGCLSAHSETIPVKTISVDLSHYIAPSPSLETKSKEERKEQNDTEVSNDQKTNKATESNEELKEQNDTEVLNDQKTNKTDAKLLNQHSAEIIFLSTHPGTFHFAITVDFIAKQIQLEDGSIWNISAKDIYKVLDWSIRDIVVITPNSEWFPGPYNFRLVNQSTGDSIAVQLGLFLTPFYHTTYNYQILCIDDANQRIWLNDGSCWDIAFWDYSYEWQVGDTIIIGANPNSLTKPTLLINANLATSARAICVQY